MNFHTWNRSDSELQGAIPISHPQVPLHALSCLHLPQVRLCTLLKIFISTQAHSQRCFAPLCFCRCGGDKATRDHWEGGNGDIFQGWHGRALCWAADWGNLIDMLEVIVCLFP